MRIQLHPYILMIGLLVFASSCTKEQDEPFEYPEPDITEPTTVTHMTRTIASEEEWNHEQNANNCEEGIALNDIASYDFSFTRGFATIHLKPTDETCSPMVSVSSAFSSNEIASDYWKSWKFELTFSELRLPDNAELWLDLKYRDVAIQWDLAPVMREVFEIDTNFSDTSGVLSINLDEGFSEFMLSGEIVEPDFSDGSGNSFNRGITNDDQYFEVVMSSKNTDEQSVFIFNFVRITSFGIPEN